MDKKGKIIISILLVLIITGCGVSYFILMPNPFKKGWSGAIITDTTWGPGEVVVSGDLFVAPSATLTILPGTTVKVLAGDADLSLVRLGDEDVDEFSQGDPTVDPDAGGNEYQKDHVTIIIKGKLQCIGTAENPIVITSSRALTSGEIPFYTDWVGIVAKDAEFAYTVVSWCVDGIYAMNDYTKLTLDNCYVAHSWGAAVGFMEPEDGSLTENARVNSTTIIDYGHEAIDMHSSGHALISYCNISDGQVGINLHDDFDGDGNHLTVNAHHNIITNTSFPVLATDGTVLNLEHNLLSSSPIPTDRWVYGGYTMVDVLQGSDDAAIMCPLGDNDASGTQISAKHNIFYQSTIGIRRDSSDITISESYNNYDDCASQFQSNPSISQGPGTLVGTSGFIDASNGNFRLSSSSPLIGAGDPSDGNPNIGLFGGSMNAENLGWHPDGISQGI